MKTKNITIVSGNPRSGTSMMTRMLQAGGIEAYHNSPTEGDEHNKGGYFQNSWVNGLSAWGGWINNVDGKAMKVHTNKLKDLPKQYFGAIEYKIIFMKRDPIASAKSLAKMHNAKVDKTDAQLTAEYEQSIKEVEQSGLNVIFINYDDMLNDTLNTCNKVNEFIGNLDVSKMVTIPDKAQKHF
jgi:hypothetical protein